MTARARRLGSSSWAEASARATWPLTSMELGSDLSPRLCRSRWIMPRIARDHANPDAANGEVMLDIEVIGAIVPKATIVVYFAPNLTDADFSDAILAAIHDAVNKPSVISISWGGPEDQATGQFQDAVKSALEDAQSLNITVLVASGDNGAADMPPAGKGQWDGKAHVDFPASSPLVLACGATHIDLSGTTLAGEGAWNQGFADTDAGMDSFGSVGGGISDVFTPPPPWQAIPYAAMSETSSNC